MDYPIGNYPVEIPDRLPKGKVLVHNDVTKAHPSPKTGHSRLSVLD